MSKGEIEETMFHFSQPASGEWDCAGRSSCADWGAQGRELRVGCGKTEGGAFRLFGVSEILSGTGFTGGRSQAAGRITWWTCRVRVSYHHFAECALAQFVAKKSKPGITNLGVPKIGGGGGAPLFGWFSKEAARAPSNQIQPVCTPELWNTTTSFART